jgi:hypothetical protein
MKRSHLGIILVDICIGLRLGFVNDDVHRVSGVSNCSLQLDADVVLFSKGSVDLVVLDRSFLNCVFKFSWQVHT